MLTAEQRKVVNSVNSRQELHELWDALKWRAKQLDAAAAAQFASGDRVWFQGRRFVTVVGTVTRMHGQKVGVRSDGGVMWKVPPSLLKKVGDAQMVDGRIASGF